MDNTISVIIPVYNAENRISKMLNCLQNQSFQNLEVILVDDGSDDGTLGICERFANDNNHIKVIHQENQGVAVARNLGLQQVNGEFIAFLDADDEIPSNYFEELIKAQKEYDADVTVCDVVIISGRREANRFTYETAVLNQKQALDFLLSRVNINSGPCAKLFRKSIIKDIRFPQLKAYEDIIFVAEAFEKASVIAITNKTEYRYIQNTDGAMFSFSKSPSLDIVNATKYLVRFINKHKELSSKCYYITLSHLMQYLQMIDKGDKANQFKKETRKLFRKNIIGISFCKSFPCKEKILFTMTAFGIAYVLL